MNRALALFAKTPLPGQVKTRLSPPLTPEEGAECYRCLLLDTVNRVRPLPYELCLCYQGDESFFHAQTPGVTLLRQAGGGLGRRLEAAFDALSAAGHGLRVVIGTDAPDLPLSFIDEAFRLLEQGSGVVFGPAEDGGYYLVGLSGVYAGLFRDIPWSGPDVLEKSLERAAEAGLTTSLLPAWYDVDDYRDLFRQGLSDPENGAPLTRAFIGALRLRQTDTTS